jgi:alkenylglycerophosphocholine/alkenylglycerophosphoethanolamine hydrolase
VTATAFLMLTLAALAAAVDWFAVGSGMRGLEYVAKPLTLVALIGAAASLDVSDGPVQGAFVVALVFSLIGDVLLMVPGESWFVFGLGSFLAAHVAYIVAFWLVGVSVFPLLIGVVVVAVAVVVLGRRIVSGVAAGPEPELVVPVAVYIGAISLMVASAIGTTGALAIIGASLFYVSDALIAWTRFIKDLKWGRLAVIMTYHLAQFALVLSLA